MRTKLLVAAVALVCLTNLGALGLGAMNRAGATSDLALTERELRLAANPTTITMLRLRWLQPSPLAFGDVFVERAGYSVPPRGTEQDMREYARRQAPRHVYVALEYDGPAWQQYRDGVLRKEPAGMSPLTPPQIEQQRRSREDAIAVHSRLFAIDVDRDPDRLRARHPDRSHVLITRTAVALTQQYGRGSLLVLSVTQLTPEQINVPRPFSTKLRELTNGQPSGYGDPLATPPRYSVHLRYGRFYEPWIVDITRH